MVRVFRNVDTTFHVHVFYWFLQALDSDRLSAFVLFVQKPQHSSQSHYLFLIVIVNALEPFYLFSLVINTLILDTDFGHESFVRFLQCFVASF